MNYNPFQQSSAPFGPSSHWPTKSTPTPTPPGYAPGVTQSTISQPGPGVTPTGYTPSTGAVSPNNPLMTALGKGLTNLWQTLASWNTPASGGGYSGGGAQPTSLSQPGSWGYSAPNPPTLSQPSIK